MIGENQRQEIIIIKRGGEGEEGHHGGAWKIAFADFMTAMMALFLVLWLVNAANEETKKAVASYFNPVKLVDRNQSRKGLDEQSGGPSQGEESGGSKTTPPAAPKDTITEAEKDVDGTFFEDPFASLEAIAQTEMKKQAAAREGGGNENSKVEGEADPFPDPFDPRPVLAPREAKDGNSTSIAAADRTLGVKAEPPASDVRQVTGEEVPENVNVDPEHLDTTKPSPDKTASTSSSIAKGTDSGPVESDAAQVEDEVATAGIKKDERAEKIKVLSQKILEDIQAEIALAFDDTKAMNSALSVKAVEDGVLISVTDVLNYPMFEIGSAVPRGRIVLAMEKIGLVLAKQSGPLRIYGHTDARPYKEGSGDNWQLSSQRALAAYYMLGRAGLNVQRVTQVSGFADRKLRDTASPNADANRRIELLLEVK